MQLINAKLCLDCDTIHEGTQCPKCASTHYWWISHFIPLIYKRSRNETVANHTIRLASVPPRPMDE